MILNEILNGTAFVLLLLVGVGFTLLGWEEQDGWEGLFGIVCLLLIAMKITLLLGVPR